MVYFLYIALGFVMGVTFVLIIGLFASRQDRKTEDLREESEEKRVKIVFKQDGKEI